ncbi:MAG: 39S ribosomal protein L45 [Azoarcus sp.]|jgi:predicted lipid-binding transport protein (Tim44 family)|nr:39S ribosomal protein L45 [Azoarcus sp.]
MKHALFAILIAVFSFSLLVDDAHARRFGGGSSFGMKRSLPPASAPKQNYNRQQQGTPSAGQPGRRSWMGPLAGLATGIGLAALLSHFGLGEEMAGFVMLLLFAAAALFLFRMFRRGMGVQRLQYAGADAAAGQYDRAAALPGATAAAAPTLAEDFDAEAFVRQAKINFIRLQTANDAGNLDDIREFVTPEVFAEISVQITERSGAAQQTDVVELDAEVMDVAEESGRYIVSVRFSGLLREEKDASPAPFSEIWHLVKPVRGGEGWRVAGIQQIA